MANRLSKLRSAMVKLRLDALLVSSVPNITYLTSFSHFSKIEREAFLFITLNKQYILTDGRYAEAVINNIKNFELIEISGKRTFEKALKDLAKKYRIKQVGFDHHDITVAEHKKLSSCFNDLNLPREISKKFFRGHFSVDKLRIIKSPAEISAIEKACKLGDKTFKYILNKIKVGVTEKQLAFEIEFFIKKHGADISFPPIVAFGANSAIPHHKSSNTPLLSTRHSGDQAKPETPESPTVQRDSGQARMTSDQFILIDFGVKLNNYCSDMTRTVFFGQPTNEQKKMYRTVLEAQKRAIEFISSTFHSLPSHEKQIKASQVDKVARTYILEKGFSTIPHSLGHGVGLEVHEAPRLSSKSKDILKEGMVFTIEPGIYLPGFGGVRIEDVVVLEKNKIRLLTNSTKKLIEL